MDAIIPGAAGPDIKVVGYGSGGGGLIGRTSMGPRRLTKAEEATYYQEVKKLAKIKAKSDTALTTANESQAAL